MIFNEVNVVVLIVIIVLGGYSTYFRNKDDFDNSNFIISLLLWLVLPILGYVSVNLFFNGEVTIYYWVATVIILLTQLVALLHFKDIEIINAKFHEIFEISLILSTFLISSLLLPIYLFDSKDNANVDESKILDIAEIENSFNDISNTMSELESKVKNEVQEIDILSQNILKQIEDKKEELLATQIRQENLEKEVEYFKRLSKLSEEDAKAVISVLKENQDKGKYIEYLLGFVIGIIGSVIANILYKRIDKDTN